MQISIVKPPADTFGFRAVDVRNFTELGKLATENNISTGIFKGGHRNRENFEVAYFIGLDFDNDPKELTCPPMSIDQARDAFADYSHIILPSRSHRKEKNGIVADRFRVILVLEAPITHAATFYSTWHWCKAQWPAIDDKCKDPSRLWYQHSSIDSMKTGGLKVRPVSPEPEKPSKGSIDLSALSPEQRGKLSREALELLANGVSQGRRSNTVFKVAKDFQQNLYSLEEAEARILAALEFTGTLASDFTEAEARQTIRSAYNSEAKHDPRIKPKAFNLLPIGELYKTNSVVEWLVEDLLTVGGVSLMSSDPKAGKSTLVRQLMREVLRGTKFLGRQCKRGAVHYYGIEEQLEVVNASFKRLGINNGEPLFVHVGDPLADSKMEDFREILMESRPAIAVIDTMFDFLDVESENNYKEVKRELRRIRQIARESGTHILLVHHNSKGQKDDRRRGNRGILGSQAIAGGVDTIMVLEVEGENRLMTSSGREIRRWVNRILVFDKADRTYSLGQEVDEFQ